MHVNMRDFLRLGQVRELDVVMRDAKHSAKSQDAPWLVDMITVYFVELLRSEDSVEVK